MTPSVFLHPFSYETLCTPTRRLFLAGVAASTLARASAEERPVVVGSKLDLEGGLLGNIMLLALAKAKIATENRLRIGPTSILREALLSGAIDLCPEYTGNAAFFFHEDGNPVWKDAAAGYARAKKLDYEKNRLVWLTPAPADNSWVIAVPESLARIHDLRTMVDFARFVRDGNKVKLAASAEFVESAAGLPAFEAVYGFRLAARQLLVLSGGETSATMKSAADGFSGVNAAWPTRPMARLKPSTFMLSKVPAVPSRSMRQHPWHRKQPSRAIRELAIFSPRFSQNSILRACVI
jgi:osmoprotectant transport system substrate-binding protein